MTDDTVDALLKATELTPDGYETMVRSPEWDRAHKCHDWRNHVPDKLVEVWDNLPAAARLAVYLMAEWDAHNEEWD